MHNGDAAILLDALALYESVANFWQAAQHSTEAEKELGRIKVAAVARLRAEVSRRDSALLGRTTFLPPLLMGHDDGPARKATSTCRTCRDSSGWLDGNDPKGAMHDWRADHIHSTGHTEFDVWRVKRETLFDVPRVEPGTSGGDSSHV